MDYNDLLLRAFDDTGGSVVQPTALKKALGNRGVSTCCAAELIEAAIQSGVLLATRCGGLRLRTKLNNEASR